MSDDERATDRWENEGGGRREKYMNPKIQRIARSWLLPITILVLSPFILGKAWAKWRKR
jgi:hypothetical protein